MIYEATDKWSSFDSLTHYGVKGMKWGVRHDRSPSSNSFAKIGSKLKSSGNKIYKVVSDYDRLDRLYRKAVKVGSKFASNEKLMTYASIGITALSSNPAVLMGAAAIGTGILAYSIYSMKHDDLQDGSDYLEHYGVKGMKWGVRKVRETVGRIRRRRAEKRYAKALRKEQTRMERNAKAIASGDSKKIIKRMPKMTNEEIALAINRLNMQKSVYQIDEQIRNYQNSVKDNTFFGRLLADKNSGYNNGNKEKGAIRTAIGKQWEGLVNNAVESAVTAKITGNSFSDTFKKKYGYKSDAEKRFDKLQKRIETSRSIMNQMAMQTELYKFSDDEYKNKINNGADLYDKDLEDIMKHVNSSKLGQINYYAGQKKK